MLNLGWHDYLLMISLTACIAGLLLLLDAHRAQPDESQDTEPTLFRMTFAYWMVYCVAFGVQKVCSPDWDVALQSLRITAALSYFLTFACILCLPLHRLAVRHVEE